MRKELIDSFSEECDKACSSNNESEIDKLLSTMRTYENKYCNDETVIAHILFILGNLYSAKAKLNNEKIQNWRNGNLPQNLVNSLNYYREAADRINETSCYNIKYEIQTNIANSLCNFYRVIEAIDLYTFKYNLDIKHDAYFVAPFAKAETLIWLASILNDPSHKIYYNYEACKIYEHLIKNIDKITHPELKNKLKNSPVIKNLIQFRNKNTLKRKNDKQAAVCTSFKSKKEFMYKQWCTDNCLFLNPINDVKKELFVAHDILQFPDYIARVGEGPYFSAAFSDIKNKYCKARYLFYCGMFENYPKWLEKDLYLTDTLDYVDYSTNIEILKIAQKQCFSILDSLAKLIAEYFQIKSKSNICFKPKWFVENLYEINNIFIDALFYLSCDLVEFTNKKTDVKIKPSAKHLKKLRNDYEHNWVRIAEDKSHQLWNKTNDYATIKTKEEFKRDVMESFKIARSAIFYCVFAISENEKIKSKNAPLLHIETPIWLDYY